MTKDIAKPQKFGKLYFSHFIIGGDDMNKTKLKMIAEKIAGIACIILGIALGYQGVKMVTKKKYARGYINLDETD